MTRVEIRIELLRIASAMSRDDIRALDFARAWEVWVLEAMEANPDQGEAQAPNKPAKAKA